MFENIKHFFLSIYYIGLFIAITVAISIFALFNPKIMDAIDSTLDDEYYN